MKKIDWKPYDFELANLARCRKSHAHIVTAQTQYHLRDGSLMEHFLDRMIEGKTTPWRKTNQGKSTKPV
jgi:hypothetical protein